MLIPLLVLFTLQGDKATEIGNGWTKFFDAASSVKTIEYTQQITKPTPSSQFHRFARRGEDLLVCSSYDQLSMVRISNAKYDAYAQSNSDTKGVFDANTQWTTSKLDSHQQADPRLKGLIGIIDSGGIVIGGSAPLQYLHPSKPYIIAQKFESKGDSIEFTFEIDHQQIEPLSFNHAWAKGGKMTLSATEPFLPTKVVMDCQDGSTNVDHFEYQTVDGFLFAKSINLKKYPPDVAYTEDEVSVSSISNYTLVSDLERPASEFSLDYYGVAEPKMPGRSWFQSWHFILVGFAILAGVLVMKYRQDSSHQMP